MQNGIDALARRRRQNQPAAKLARSGERQHQTDTLAASAAAYRLIPEPLEQVSGDAWSIISDTQYRLMCIDGQLQFNLAMLGDRLAGVIEQGQHNLSQQLLVKHGTAGGR